MRDADPIQAVRNRGAKEVRYRYSLCGGRSFDRIASFRRYGRCQFRVERDGGLHLARNADENACAQRSKRSQRSACVDELLEAPAGNEPPLAHLHRKPLSVTE